MSTERTHSEGGDQPANEAPTRPLANVLTEASQPSDQPHEPTDPPRESTAPSSEDDPPDASVAPARSRKRRLASLLLLVGAGVAVAILMPHLPSERRIELRVDDPATVLGIDLAWTAQGEAEPIQGSSWHFAPGAAPTSLVTSPRLPDGRYDLDITVERTDGRTSLRRGVTLADSERVTVPVR